MAPPKDTRVSGGIEPIPAAEGAILNVLDKKKKVKPDDTKDLWNKLKSMGDDKGLIKLLTDKDISRMWEIAVDTDIGIADLRAPDDKVLKDLRAPDNKALKDHRTKSDKAVYDKAVHDYAAAAFNDMLPQEGKSVKFIVKRKKEGGWDTLRFPWERSSEGFKEEFEMTISNGDKRNEYSVHIGDIGGYNPNEHRIDMPNLMLSVERNPDRLPLPQAVTSPDPVSRAPKSCVVIFTFGVAQGIIANEKNLALKNSQKSKEGSNEDQIIVYIRFAGPTMLVGKAFKANWATKNGNENLWGDLVLVKY